MDRRSTRVVGRPIRAGPADAAAGRRAPAVRPPSARLAVRLLGDTGVELDGRPLPDLATPRSLRLLARLALAEGPVLRDLLAADLWPGSTTPQARTNLRKLLHDLRHVLPGSGRFVETGPRTVRWSAGASASVDVVAFHEALARHDPAAAVAHYRGDLLPGCDDTWVLAERERLRRLAVDALSELMTAADRAGHDAHVVAHARRLLQLDAVHEPACRLLMRALARGGERGEALRTFHRLVEMLERELGVAPEAATIAEADRLARPLSSAARPGADGSALVGRAAEWGALHAAWQTARTGCARLVLVTGEAGIGKTRLVEELARRVAAEGGAVAYGRAYEAAGGLPWGPVIDWLGSGAVRPGLRRLPDVWRAELARLLPELGSGRPRPPDTEPPRAPEPARRHRLLDAVRTGLLAGTRPLLLVVDDVQWCDQDTVDLCGYLVRSAPSAPVLVACTARDDETGEHHPVTRLRRYVAPALATVALGPLDREATTTMAAALSAHAVDAATAERLWRETGGNPLFVAEAARAGLAGGGAARVTALTPTVHAVITARLDHLSTGARRLVEVAATIGRAFAPAVLATAAGRAEDDLADDLDELWLRHVLRERGPAYDFAHDRIRDVALGSISPARRRKLHRAVAGALEHHHRGDLGPVSARLAAHYEAAGLERRAVEAYERAAAHAYRVFALDDGIALSLRALRLLDDMPRGAARDEVELRLRAALGVPLVARRGYGAPAVGRCYERALTLHRRLGTRPSPAVLRGLALHAVATCGFDRAGELGRELVAAARRDHLALVEGEYVLGVTDFWRGDFRDAERHLLDAIATYRVEDSPRHIARFAQDPNAVCLSRLALTQLFRGRDRQADATMRRATRVADELDHPMTTGYVRAFDAIRSALSPETGDLGRAVAALEAVTSPMHIGYFDAVARMLAGWRDVLDGDLHGVAAIRDITDLLRREQPLHLSFGLGLLARGLLRAGDVAAGRATIADALAWTARTGQHYLQAELQRIDAELVALEGDVGAATAAARSAVDTAVEQDAGWLRDRAQATLDRLTGP